ncbi:hypothetical protein VTN00DRAFT_446 [Thermoascus crustaceus]|uniref:uncharacterized protein n=1 Tax=Thermoascus crustaceus TaxID=5088 RepID=UPI003744025B
MNGATSDDQRVLVIGAGAAGLLIAQVLKKQSIPCVVFEQDARPDARPRDWNYGIYWAQSSLSECLPQALIDQLQSAQVDSHVPSEDDFVSVFNGQTGERLIDVPAPLNIRLQRRRFLKLIATGVEIQYGKRLVGVESNPKTATATAIFQDGSRETGRLLIGTEGAHSRVREYLLGKEKAALCPLPLVATATITRLPEDVVRSVRGGLHPRYSIAFHPDGYFLWLGIHSDAPNPADCEFMLVISWISESETGLSSSGEKILEDLRQRASIFEDPFRKVLLSIPPDTRLWHNRLSQWPTQPWDNRNATVTLAGDAAHPMTFHRGQGLNNAILDAASLNRQIQIALQENKNNNKSVDYSPLGAVVAAYEKELWERGKEAVESSNLNSLAIHDWEKLQKSPLFTAGLKRETVVKAETASS